MDDNYNQQLSIVEDEDFEWYNINVINSDHSKNEVDIYNKSVNNVAKRLRMKLMKKTCEQRIQEQRIEFLEMIAEKNKKIEEQSIIIKEQSANIEEQSIIIKEQSAKIEEQSIIIKEQSAKIDFMFNILKSNGMIPEVS